ncbi:RNA polymerase sigma factor SigZ [Vibrio hannami]|uniref:RNA polymerase sigma factor SigZ n=1 Tax=Vibrio hannami TaxID=2717094 RepID=UPI00240F3E51|nr:RNA polymerase sigma factor SigZ [Vibrio hannami]MDG3085732.1 RNA polymerase sigma factor SigZ [Vibrio hannami]
MDVEKVWLEYQSGLKAFLNKNISNTDDVDDLLQDIFLKTYKNLPSVSDQEKIKPWLYQVTNNAIMDFYRQSSKESGILSEELWQKQPEENIQRELSRCIAPFIYSLPEEDAELLVAIELDGISQKEYAQKSGIKYSTLKSRVQKSRKLLHKVFTECCEFTLSHSGGVIEYSRKKKGCTGC